MKKIGKILLSVLLCSLILSLNMNFVEAKVNFEETFINKDDAGGTSGGTTEETKEKTHSASSSWSSDGTSHYKSCSCGDSSCTKKYDEGKHTGGYATCYSKRTCSTCYLSYGSYASHYVGSDKGYYRIANTETHGQKCAYGCGTYLNTTACSGTKYDADADNHWNICSSCGEAYNIVSHIKTKWGQADEEYHYEVCSVTECPYNAIDKAFSKGKHYYNGEDNTHTCRVSGCTFVSKTHHGFSGFNNTCKHDYCTAILDIESSYGSEISSLPNYNDYYMIGYGGDESWEKSLTVANIGTVNNLIPYSSCDSDGYLSIVITVWEYTHGNWEYHSNANVNAQISLGKEPDEIVNWPIDNLPKKLGDWKNIVGTFPKIGEHEVTGTWNGSNFVATGFPTTHGLVYSIDVIGGGSLGAPAKIFCNGGPHPEPTPIPAYLWYGYRDTEGNMIPDITGDYDENGPEGVKVIEDKVQKVITWINGNTGASFNAVADLQRLEEFRL